MNMRFTVPDAAIVQEPGFYTPRHNADGNTFDAGRMASLAIAIALHVVLITAIVYGGFHVAKVIVPQTVTVSIEQPKPEELPPPPPPPDLIKPEVETIAPPDVRIAVDTPPPITVQVQEKPVVRTDPPQPVASETQASYYGRVLAHLNRYKRTLAEAHLPKVSGVVMVHLIMDKDGKVISSEIAKSSGRSGLDAEALALIQRAQPLPAIPPGFGKDQLNAVVPIQFSLH